MGSVNYPLSERIQSGVDVHGAQWTHWHYCLNRRGPRLSTWEYRAMRVASINGATA